MPLAESIDRLLGAPVLVFGSLPPAGRDLDLLARRDEQEALSAWLERGGFLERGGEWVRFHDCGVDSLDLVPVSAWGLPGAAASELFDEALPIPGFELLVRPAPRHLLLIYARRLAEGNGRMPDKHRKGIADALAEDGAAWEGARSAAPEWQAERSLALLDRAYHSGRSVSRTARASALAQWPFAQGRTRWRALVRGWLEARRAEQQSRGQLITFSGLDGAGKSSQAEGLRDALERLGRKTTMQWVRLEWTTLWENRWLGILGWPARTVLGLMARARGSSGGVDAAPALTPAAVRERSGLVANVWVTVVALAHASAQRREVRTHLRRGEAVICDRYTLDAAAHLRFRYGERRPFRLQIRLLERLSPRPLRAYFVDVPAETAYARKAEQYSLEDLTRQAQLYRQEAPGLNVKTVDGERGREDLCAEIAEEVWRAL
jgi:thymidylate kinase